MIIVPNCVALPAELVVLIGISLLTYMILCICLTYFEYKRRSFTEQSVLTTLLIACIIPIIVSITIGCFITYLIFK